MREFPNCKHFFFSFNEVEWQAGNSLFFCLSFNAVATGLPPPYIHDFKLDPADYHHMFLKQNLLPPTVAACHHTLRTVRLWIKPSGTSSGGKFMLSTMEVSIHIKLSKFCVTVSWLWNSGPLVQYLIAKVYLPFSLKITKSSLSNWVKIIFTEQLNIGFHMR